MGAHPPRARQASVGLPGGTAATIEEAMLAVVALAALGTVGHDTALATLTDMAERATSGGYKPRIAFVARALS